MFVSLTMVLRIGHLRIHQADQVQPHIEAIFQWLKDSILQGCERLVVILDVRGLPFILQSCRRANARQYAFMAYQSSGQRPKISNWSLKCKVILYPN